MIEWFQNNTPPLLLAFMGGLADFLFTEEHKLSTLLISAFLAISMGYLSLLACVEYGVSQEKTGILCWFAGYSSKHILTAMRRIRGKKIVILVFGALGLKLSEKDFDDEKIKKGGEKTEGGKDDRPRH